MAQLNSITIATITTHRGVQATSSPGHPASLKNPLTSSSEVMPLLSRSKPASHLVRRLSPAWCLHELRQAVAGTQAPRELPPAPATVGTRSPPTASATT